MNVKILGRLCGSGKVIPFYTFKIPAGFPNPAADHIEQDFSFDRLMDLRAPHIYVAKIDGDSMEGAKIFHDSLVVVDRSRKPSTDQILHSYTMLTVNADDHGFMKAYHKPHDEKRMVVILPKGSYADWLTARPEQSAAFMNQYPADRLAVAM